MSRYKVKSEIIPCDICGKQMHARGIGTHKRQVHFMKENFVTKVSDNNNGGVTKVTSEIGIDLSEYEHPNSKLYTELDLKILLGKICRLVFSENSHNLLSVLDTNRIASKLITDFEKRFDCKFSDVKMAFPNVRAGVTNTENWKFISFADLSYSK